DGRGASGNSTTTYLLTRPILLTRTSNFNPIIRLKHTLDYLVDGLNVSGTVSYSDTYQKGRTNTYQPPRYNVGRHPDNPTEILFFGGSTSPVSISDNVYNNEYSRLYLEGKVEYSTTLGKHALSGLLLYNAQQLRDPNLEFNVPSGMIGSAGRVTYGFDNRYLAEFNMGYNGSENFPDGKRFGFFPALSAGWIVTNEGF